jgi:hypothetical protein
MHRKRDVPGHHVFAGLLELSTCPICSSSGNVSRRSFVEFDSCSANSDNPPGSFPSTACLMSDIVLSMLRLRVLGLVIVVPRLTWRACPRRNGEPEPVAEVGELGEYCPPPRDLLVEGGVPSCGCGGTDEAEADGEILPFATAASMAALIPLGEGIDLSSSPGVAGLERCGATSSGSIRSGGRRSFSMSDFRLFRTA